MSDISSFGVVPPVISPLTTQTDKLLRHAPSEMTENKKIDKAAKDFESVLLSSWLQGAEKSFGSVPGEDDDDDADPGKDQFQGLGTQALGSSMTAAGGIGIAKMIAQALHKADAQATPPADQSDHLAPLKAPPPRQPGQGSQLTYFPASATD